MICFDNHHLTITCYCTSKILYSTMITNEIIKYSALHKLHQFWMVEKVVKQNKKDEQVVCTFIQCKFQWTTVDAHKLVVSSNRYADIKWKIMQVKGDARIMIRYQILIILIYILMSFCFYKTV